MHWVSKDLSEIGVDPTVQNIMNVLIEGAPAALVQYKSLLQQSNLAAPPDSTEAQASPSNHASLQTGKPLSTDVHQISADQPHEQNGESTRDPLHKLFAGVTFGKSVQILGMRNVRIGSGSCIGDDVWLNVCLRDNQVRLVIGEKVLIGRRCMISTGGHLDIGDFCVFAPNVYVSDADHKFYNITLPILEQGATINRSVIIEENCWLGINAVVMGEVTVGRGSVVAANSVVISDIAPFSVVAGNPSKPIKMYNPLSSQWERVTDEKSILRIEDARRTSLLPSRDELRKLLKRNSHMNAVDPVVAGRGVHL